ncbi:MAG: hypothetical protein J07HB67_01895 [halophilic archaeon J07HB67]|nr:MAG: hypothetical protein J07HB67_01895 [halophilic archaeon J07HB67]
MSVTGLCQICEAATAREACTTCGAAVCRDHYDETTGVCGTCAGSHGSGPRWARCDGIDRF